jgi:hypothetical protein
LLDEETLLFSGMEKIPQRGRAGTGQACSLASNIYRSTTAAAVLLCLAAFLMAVLNRQQVLAGDIEGCRRLIERCEIDPGRRGQRRKDQQSGRDMVDPIQRCIVVGKSPGQLIERVEVLESVCAIAALQD